MPLIDSLDILISSVISAYRFDTSLVVTCERVGARDTDFESLYADLRRLLRMCFAQEFVLILLLALVWTILLLVGVDHRDDDFFFLRILKLFLDECFLLVPWMEDQ